MPRIASARHEDLARRIFAFFALVFVVAVSIPEIILKSLNSSPSSLPSAIFESSVIVCFAAVGALIMFRQPANAIGRLFAVAAMVWASSSFSLEYAYFGLITHPGALPGSDWMGVIGNSAQSLGFFIIFTYLLMLFPTGRLPSSRWRPLLVATSILLGGLMLVTLLGATTDNNTQLAQVLKNPIQILDGDLSNVSSTLLLFGLFIVAILSGVSLIVRARRAAGIERQQIKWLGFAALLCVVFVIVLIVDVLVANGTFSDVLFYLPLIAIALATGISILRYRLFDIDVIIRRTLVYGSLTVILAGVYFLGVAGAQTLLNTLTRHQEQQSPVLIVVTTLLIAALFQPIRRRVQGFIDRRFFRLRYDARKTLDTFGTALRNDVELTHLTASLLGVVEQTMHPAHVSLWLRDQEISRSNGGQPQR